MKHCPKHVLDEIVRRIVGALRPIEVYLFGSHACGDTHRDSDIDLLVVVPDAAGSPRELARRGRRSLWGMCVPVDVMVCTSSEMAKWAKARCNLVHTAVAAGRRLYASGR